jgi:hypothetical protein
MASLMAGMCNLQSCRTRSIPGTNVTISCPAEGEARFGHLDLLFLWHPAEDHAQPWILHLVPALST